MIDNNIIQKAHPLYPNQNQVSWTYKNENENPGTHYVMWSGGCDSTLLLYELIEAYGSENVVAISYKYPWLLSVKRESENNHRDAFKAKMKLFGKKYEIQRHLEFDINITAITGKYENARCMGLPQAVAWLLSVPLYASDDSYIYTGAIRSDDLTLKLEGYYQMFEGVARTLNKNIVLREPYLYLTKADVISKLFQYGIYDETWYCEIPEEVGSECYSCQPCRTHISALTEVSLIDPTSLISMQAKDRLDRIEKIKNYRKENPKEYKIDSERL